MQALALPLMVAGSLVKGIGGYTAGKAQAKAEQQNAHLAEVEGAAEAQRVREAARGAMGRQVGAQAESGFLPGTGSALDSLEESAINAQLDILNVRRKASLEAYGHRRQAALAKQQGRMALTGSLIGAAGAIAGHFSDYAQLNKDFGYGSGGSGGGSSGGGNWSRGEW